jgi:Domain of unknown function (DUF1735).
MKKIIFIFLVGLVLLSSCKNQDNEFPDYNYTTVYFAYQSPVRTLIMGSDYVYDNSLDTAHQCIIYATMGGVYSNTKNRTLDFVVDNTMCNKLTFENASGAQVLPMPSNYYTLASNQIVIPAGAMMGGVKVQFTDAYFNDPLAMSNHYVIPLRITSVNGADSILSGKPLYTTANRFVATDWITVPKDYILYAVKYKNKYDATYLRRGVETGSDVTLTYHSKYVENDQVVSSAVTKSLSELYLTLNAYDASKTAYPFTLDLNFDKSGNCTVANPAGTSYTISGTGKFLKNGDSWGNIKRDVLYLKYTFNNGSLSHTMTDTLVIRDRVEKVETFKPYYNQ